MTRQKISITWQHITGEPLEARLPVLELEAAIRLALEDCFARPSGAPQVEVTLRTDGQKLQLLEATQGGARVDLQAFNCLYILKNLKSAGLTVSRL